MPIPVLVLAAMAIKAVVAKTAVVKTVAVASKGAVVLGKAAAGHGAVVAKTAVIATKTYGAATVISAATIATISVGAAALIIEKAQRFKREIEHGSITDALIAAASLLSELKGIGGLEDVCSTLDSFISSSSGSDAAEAAEKTAVLLKSLENQIKTI